MLRNFGRVLHVKCIFNNKPAARCMAGHSKWANIKHTKAQKDGQRAALFTKMARQIRLAVQDGGSADLGLNTQLRSVVDIAVKKNMPMASIKNTIKKSQQSKSQLQKCRLDIRLKQKVYIICTIYTDNFAGLKMDATAMVKKSGGIFVDVSHMFEDIGLVEAKYDSGKLPDEHSLEERAMEDAIEVGAEEVEIIDSQSNTVNFFCSPTHLTGLSKALEKKGYDIENSEHLYNPNNLVQLSSEEQVAYDIFLDKLRDLPGLEDIYDNVQRD